MYKQFLCVGGEQDGHYIKVREPEQMIELSVYPKINFRNFFGIITLKTQPVRIEIYRRKKIGDDEYFCLEALTDDEIITKLSR